MVYKETPIQVRCAITKQPETVYIRVLDYQGIHMEDFNGCDNYCNSEKCLVTCKESAMAKYAQILSEGPLPLWHRP